MPAPIFTAGPTLTNPNALKTVAKLRAALHDANGIILDLSARNHDLQVVACEASQAVASLIAARRKHGDQAVLQLLTQLEESLLTPQPNAAELTH